MNNKVETKNAPAAIGPFSQGVQAGNMLFVSGQLPIDPKTGLFAGDDIESQTRQSLANVNAVLEEAGFSMSDVVKTTVLMQNMDDFAKMNAIYAECFTEPFPARAAFEVVCLPKKALIEIEAIAVK